MLPDPLHPAVVHFPIVLALLAPLIAAALLFAIQSGRAPARAWVGVVVLQLAVVGAGWVATEAGEDEEERVEEVVPESAIEAHEESAERFMWIAGVALPIVAAGLLGGPIGMGARVAGVVVTLVAAWAVMDAGSHGGDLVYRHGAANAYIDTGGAGSGRAGGDHDHDDH
jgi:uncharacterized membrane protein